MKSKEEIEQLAEKSTIGVLPSHLDYRFIEVYKQFYIDGYKQCQEDVKQKLEQFYNHGKWAIIEHGHGDTFEDYYNKVFKQI